MSPAHALACIPQASRSPRTLHPTHWNWGKGRAEFCPWGHTQAVPTRTPGGTGTTPNPVFQRLYGLRHLLPTPLFCSAHPPALQCLLPFGELYMCLPCLNIKLLQGRTFVHFVQGGLPEGLELGGRRYVLELVLAYRQEGPIFLDKMLKVKRVCEINGQARGA